MLGDIGIVVFALIGIFAKKRWAAIVATIWFSVSIFINLQYNISSFDPALNEDFAFFGGIIEIVLIIGSWTRSRGK
jgi:hypothetical protein